MEKQDIPVELKTSELYHRHKRNLIFFASIAIVFALTDKPGGHLEIPGTGGARILTFWAFVLIACAIIYSALQYATEFVAVRARNAHGWADREGGVLDDALKAQAEVVRDQISRIERFESRLNNHLKGYLNVMSGAHEGISAIAKAPLGGGIATRAWMPDHAEIRSISDSLKLQIDANLEKTNSQATLVLDAARNLKEDLHLIATSSTALQTRFRQLSRSIHGSQRLGMAVLDGAVPALMTLVSLLICIAGMAGWLRS